MHDAQNSNTMREILSRTEPRIVYFKSYYVELQEQWLQSLRGIGMTVLQ